MTTHNTTNITSQHRAVFSALSSGQYQNFALFSCFVDGQPATAIVVVTESNGQYLIQPLFVSITPTMHITDHDGILPTPQST